MLTRNVVVGLIVSLALALAACGAAQTAAPQPAPAPTQAQAQAPAPAAPVQASAPAQPALAQPTAQPPAAAPTERPQAPAQGQAQGKASGSGWQGAFQGLGELTVEQAAVKYRADYKQLVAQVNVPGNDPFASITALSAKGLDKAALQNALNQLGKIQNPDTKALETKRQQDFDQLMTLQHAQYKTGLVATNQKNPEASQKSITELARLWQDISDLYAVTPPPAFAGDKAWSADLGKIVKDVTAAKTAMDKGDIAEAHEALEPVREILLDVRTRNNAALFIDKFTVYHSAMEGVISPALAKTVETLTADDIVTLKAAYPKMAEAFAAIEQPPATLSAEQAQMYQGIAQTERAAINVMNQALQSGDKAAIIKAANDLKSSFAKLFAQFG